MKLRMLIERPTGYLVCDQAGYELYCGNSHFVACLIATVMNGLVV